MALGEFTKQEAEETMKALNELFEGLAKVKRMDYLWHLNDISSFINSAKQNAPDQPVNESERR